MEISKTGPGNFRKVHEILLFFPSKISPHISIQHRLINHCPAHLVVGPRINYSENEQTEHRTADHAEQSQGRLHIIITHKQ